MFTTLALGSAAADTISLISINSGAIHLLRDVNTETFDIEVQTPTTLDITDSITGPVGSVLAGESGTSYFLVGNSLLTEVGAVLFDFSNPFITDTTISVGAIGVPLTGITDAALIRLTSGYQVYSFNLDSFDPQTGLAIYSFGSAYGVMVPEPTTFAFAAVGLGVIAWRRRRA